MLYKKPIITLTSLLDLLFIIIFAYQMDIRTSADKYVQAEVDRRLSESTPDQKEMIAKLEVEVKKTKDELATKDKEIQAEEEAARENGEIARQYKLQSEEHKAKSEKYKTQRDQLREHLESITKKQVIENTDKTKLREYEQEIDDLIEELQKKEKSLEAALQKGEYVVNETVKTGKRLAAAKQEIKRLKEQSKSKGVMPITDKDAELAKALVGTWEGSNPYRGLYRSYRTTLSPDNSFTGYKTITANVDCIVGTLRLNKGESVSVNTTGTWWVKGGYIHVFIESSNNTKVIPIGHSSSSKILSVDEDTSRFQEDDNSINTDYRIKGN